MFSDIPNTLQTMSRPQTQMYGTMINMTSRTNPLQMEQVLGPVTSMPGRNCPPLGCPLKNDTCNGKDGLVSGPKTKGLLRPHFQGMGITASGRGAL